VAVEAVDQLDLYLLQVIMEQEEQLDLEVAVLEVLLEALELLEVQEL
tara:strand:+ start:573 stop:713 length:141 start_codon:yes stop_codon:yes gene_type:complete